MNSLKKLFIVSLGVLLLASIALFAACAENAMVNEEDTGIYTISIENHNPDRGEIALTAPKNVSNKRYEEGEEVTVIAIPKSGFAVDIFIVGGQNVPVTQQPVEYKFNIKANTVVEVSFKTEGEDNSDVTDSDNTNSDTTGNNGKEPENKEPEKKSYTIAFEYDSEQGTVTKYPDKEKYDGGETVTVTVTPNEGYEVDGFTVSDITDAALTDGSYTFKINSNVKVTVTFKKTVFRFDEAYTGLYLAEGQNPAYTVNITEDKLYFKIGNGEFNEVEILNYSLSGGVKFTFDGINYELKPNTLSENPFEMVILYPSQGNITMCYRFKFNSEYIGHWTSIDGEHVADINERDITIDSKKFENLRMDIVYNAYFFQWDGKEYELSMRNNLLYLYWYDQGNLDNVLPTIFINYDYLPELFIPNVFVDSWVTDDGEHSLVIEEDGVTFDGNSAVYICYIQVIDGLAIVADGKYYTFNIMGTATGDESDIIDFHGREYNPDNPGSGLPAYTFHRFRIVIDEEFFGEYEGEYQVTPSSVNIWKVKIERSRIWLTIYGHTVEGTLVSYDRTSGIVFTATPSGGTNETYTVTANDTQNPHESIRITRTSGGYGGSYKGTYADCERVRLKIDEKFIGSYVGYDDSDVEYRLQVTEYTVSLKIGAGQYIAATDLRIDPAYGLFFSVGGVVYNFAIVLQTKSLWFDDPVTGYAIQVKLTQL